MRTVYINEDNHHFYGTHPAEDMTPEGVDRLVDFYAAGPHVAGVLFCVNVQRALFESRVWETFWGDYDPSLGDDQPALRRTHGIRNHLLLRERGIDQHARWLARCRHHGIEGWLSMRMNDCHGLKETVLGRSDNSRHHWAPYWPSEFWKSRPDLRRAPYRMERSWEGAFDYGKEEVRRHHLALVRELFERYDMHGLEMDWMRWGMMFAPGHEAKGRGILTEFIREVRRLADAAEQRVGHKILLAHRVPAHPESALALGYDVPCWAKEGLADMVALSSFLGSAYFDYPLEIWRALLGPKVKLLAHAEAGAKPHPEHLVAGHEFMFGSAASALHRGADGIYLFNECYRESDAPELLKLEMRHLGSVDTLKSLARRHAVTFPQVRAPGEPDRAVLPLPLRLPKLGADFGRMEETLTLRISIGPGPKTGRAILRLGFGPNVAPAAVEGLEVRVNTHLVDECPAPEFISISTETAKKKGWDLDPFPPTVSASLCFELPLGLLHDDTNVIEILPPQIDGFLEWAEILLLPAARRPLVPKWSPAGEEGQETTTVGSGTNGQEPPLRSKA